MIERKQITVGTYKVRVRTLSGDEYEKIFEEKSDVYLQSVFKSKYIDSFLGFLAQPGNITKFNKVLTKKGAVLCTPRPVELKTSAIEYVYPPELISEKSEIWEWKNCRKVLWIFNEKDWVKVDG